LELWKSEGAITMHKFFLALILLKATLKLRLL
jgi:hypothetical protein